ncbi:hypothetical protein CV102_25815 [Natronococcus pandeyae]|uniref:Uncharacterized protein n=2 Tax=Natronococcus pandeyae TaxID=2055836 RepID=A0A8J8PZQ3_9EURY|nr:hypothetical protein CV102_25815 [Natronococcus pandeyae]
MQEVNETTESDESEGDSKSESEEDDDPQDEASSAGDEPQEEEKDEPDSESNETDPDGDEVPLFTLPDAAEGKLERGDHKMEKENETDGCTVTAELENIDDETYTVDAVIGAYAGEEMLVEGWLYDVTIGPEETATLEAKLGNCTDANRYEIEVTRVD